MKNKSILKTLLKITISVILLYLTLKGIKKDELLDSLSHLNFFYIPLIFLLIVSNYLVSSVRWKKLLEIYEGGKKVKLFTLIKLYFIGAFFSNFLPTSIGGDVYKAFRLGKHIDNHSNAFASTFMERFSGVVVLAIFASFGLITTFETTGLLLFILFWVSILVAFKVLDIAGSKSAKLKKFTDSLKMYKKRKDIIIYALVTSVFVQVFSILTQFLIFKAIGIEISLAYAFFAFPVITIASFLIPSINSLGVQEFLYATFFVSVGIPKAVAFSASLIYQAVRMVLSLVGGLFYATEK